MLCSIVCCHLDKIKQQVSDGHIKLSQTSSNVETRKYGNIWNNFNWYTNCKTTKVYSVLLLFWVKYYISLQNSSVFSYKTVKCITHSQDNILFQRWSTPGQMRRPVWSTERSRIEIWLDQEVLKQAGLDFFLWYKCSEHTKQRHNESQ